LNVKIENQKIRLLGCDAFELHVKGGKEAKELAMEFLSKPNNTLITFGERDSFGRILGEINNAESISLGDVLTSHGLVTGRFFNSILPHNHLIHYYNTGWNITSDLSLAPTGKILIKGNYNISTTATTTNTHAKRTPQL
jgi:hypothetical protein